MATNILMRDFKILFITYSTIEISSDAYIKRVFKIRL